MPGTGVSGGVPSSASVEKGGRELAGARERPSGRRLAHAALAAAVLTLLASCAGGHAGQSRSLQIRERHPSLRLGATKQFSIMGTGPVAWGIRESGSSPSVPVYPLEVSRDGRYLVDQRGRPWRVQADAAWLMAARATPQQVDTYLARRQSQGFNSFYLDVMVHAGGYDAAPNAPDDRRGDPPLATPGDYSTAGATPASRRYWAWLDSIIDKAAARHMVVLLAYNYLGWNGGNQGWYQNNLAQPSVRALQEWGVWLGNRFKTKANIVWLGLGDFTPPDGSEGSRRARAVADGIKSTGARQLFMAVGSPPDTIPAEVPYFASIADQNSFYGYGPQGLGTVYVTADRAWRALPTKPAWMQEGTYEYEDNTGHFSGEPWETRRGRFWAVLAGGTAGDGFGTRDVWQWKGIPSSLSTPGAAYSTFAFDLFGSLPWWTLEPSGTGRDRTELDLIASGQGDWGGLDYITSARTSNHDWVLAYVPVTKRGARTFSMEMSALGGKVRARWFDPTTGNAIAISDGYEYASIGVRRFTTPGRRGDGTDDWVLVLDSVRATRCGTITRSGLYVAPRTMPRGVTCEITAASRREPSVTDRVRVRLVPGRR